MFWTDERIESLRTLWMDGLSASKIALELGGGVTRNAVIGKVHRMGMANRVKTIDPAPTRTLVHEAPARHTPPQRRPGGAVHGNTALAMELVPMIATTPLVLEKNSSNVVIPMSQRVTIMDLRETTCRWPLGDPMASDFRYCGARSPLVGGPYCAGHASLAYQPTQDRRRAREKESRQLRSA